MTTEPSTQAPDRDVPAGRGAARGRRPTRRPVAALVALVFFFGPLAAFVLGRPARAAFENRALAELPSPSDGWSFFPDFTTWAVDHLPLRQQAVEAYAAGVGARLRRAAVLRRHRPGPAGRRGSPARAPRTASRSSTRRCIQGEDGWLYFGADVSEPVRARRAASTRRWSGSTAWPTPCEASGRRFVFTVAPDKTHDLPGQPARHLPRRGVRRRAARRLLGRAAERDPPDWYVDLREPRWRRSRSAPARSTGPPTRTGRPAARRVYAQNWPRRLDPRLLDDFEVVDAGTDHPRRRPRPACIGTRTRTR